MQALRYCGGVYEVTSTKVADDVFVQVLDLQLHLLLVTQTKKIPHLVNKKVRYRVFLLLDKKEIGHITVQKHLQRNKQNNSEVDIV